MKPVVRSASRFCESLERIVNGFHRSWAFLHENRRTSATRARISSQLHCLPGTCQAICGISTKSSNVSQNRMWRAARFSGRQEKFG
jgi:hypothetical protein